MRNRRRHLARELVNMRTYARIHRDTSEGDTSDAGTDEAIVPDETVAAQEQCETSGGTWDDLNSECLPPDTAETPEDETGDASSGPLPGDGTDTC